MGLGGAIGGLVAGGIGFFSARAEQKKAERQMKKDRKAMKEQKAIYAGLDTSNPYLNMENTMEDLTVNQQQAQFEKQQFQQSQSNILGGLRGSAGGSGVASIAASLAQQGQLASQRASASIGQQESANQMAERQMAATLQDKERAGEVMSRNWERDKQGTLLGMAQSELTASREAIATSKQQKMEALGQGISAFGSILGG